MASKKFRVRDEEERRAVISIATRIVAGMVASGECPETEEGIREAMEEVVPLAFEAYRAAIEYVFH